MRYTIEVSNRKDKKYVALLEDGRKIHFGHRLYNHYKDSTPLKAYSHLDHGDKKRRERFYQRHGTNPEPYSALYFSSKYLW